MIGAWFGKGGKRRQKKEALRKAKEVLDFVGLIDKKDSPFERITIADRKRLELARALAMEPELLFLDEVMAGLNPKEIEGVMNFVKEISKKGVTILIIEHVMKAIMGISDRVIVLHHGESIAEGTPNEISRDDKVIAAYLGARYTKLKGKGGH